MPSGPFTIWLNGTASSVTADPGSAWSNPSNASTADGITSQDTVADAGFVSAPGRTERLLILDLRTGATALGVTASTVVQSLRLVIRANESFNNSGDVYLTTQVGGVEIQADIPLSSLIDGGLGDYTTGRLDVSNYPIATLLTSTFGIGAWFDCAGNDATPEIAQIGIILNQNPTPVVRDPGHYNLPALSSIIAAGCAIMCVGDSRTQYGYRSVPGQIFRQWDITHSGIVLDALSGYACNADGLLQFQTTNGMSRDIIWPGEGSSLKFVTVGAYGGTGTAFVSGETFGNNSVQGSATKTGYVTLSSSGKLVYLPLTGTFASGDAVWGYTGGGTNTLSSTPAVLGSGYTNRFPVPLGERWRPGTGNATAYGGQFCYEAGITAGNETSLGMYSATDGTKGGTFKKGDPAQGRTVSTLECWRVANNDGKQIASNVGLTFNLDPDGPLDFSETFATDPTSGSATPVITNNTTAAVGIAGIGADLHISPKALASPGDYDTRGLTFAGFRINFTGGGRVYRVRVRPPQLVDHRSPASHGEYQRH